MALSLEITLAETVPETDTGGQVEHTKALERTLVKETRQNSTVTSGEGTLLCVKDLLRKHVRVAVTSWLRLFIKNTALCKLVRGRIGCDACPVPEG